MPNIREYNATGGLRPDSSGGEAAASAGRRIEGLTYERGQMKSQAITSLAGGVLGLASDANRMAEQYVTHKEVMKYSADLADTTNTLLKQWNEARTNADPNDLQVAADFNEKVMQPALDQFVSRYSSREGQERAAEGAGRLTAHLTSVQTADAATMAGEAAVQDLTLMTNRNADTLMADPTSLGFVNEISDEAVRNARANPLLTAAQSAQLEGLGSHFREQNTIAAFHGMANKNPEAAAAALAAGFGKDDLTAANRTMLERYADAEIKIAKQATHSDAVEKRQQETEASHEAAAKLVSSLIKDDGTIAVPKEYFQGVKQIATMPNVAPGLVDSMFNMGKRLTDEGTNKIGIGVNDAATQESFSKRMLLPPDAPDALSQADVFTARAQGKLSDEGFAFYERAVNTINKDPQKKDALTQFNRVMSTFKSSVTRSNTLTGIVVPAEDVQWGRFQTDMRARFEQAYKQDKWQNLIDPASSDYLGAAVRQYGYGTKEHLNQFRTMMRDQGGAAAPALERKPGQSAQDYLNEHK